MFKQALLAVMLGMGLSSTAQAAMISFTSGPFNGTFLDIFVTDSGDLSGGDSDDVTGLSKFDPALGTLNGVTFEVISGTFEWEAALYGEVQMGETFEVEFNADMQADLTYFNGSTSIVLMGIGDSMNYFCGGMDPDPCEDGFGNLLTYPDDTFAPVWGLGEFDPADIIGPGDVVGLGLSINLFGQSFDTLFGVDFAEVGGTANINDAVVRVTYEYDAVVPVPAAAWLFVSGLIGMAGVARRRKLA